MKAWGLKPNQLDWFISLDLNQNLLLNIILIVENYQLSQYQRIKYQILGSKITLQMSILGNYQLNTNNGGLTRLNSLQKPSSCINFKINQNQYSVQLKDYTLEEVNLKGTSQPLVHCNFQTGDCQEQSQWGFPRPCVYNDLQSYVQISQPHLIGDIQRQAQIFDEEPQATQFRDNGQVASSSCVQNINQLPQKVTRNKKIRKLANDKVAEQSERDEQDSQRQANKNKKKSKKRLQRTSQQKRLRNQTKNIIKNYSKAIIKFTGDHKNFIQYLLQQIGSNIRYEELNSCLQQQKNNITTVKQFYRFLTNPYIGYETRLISNQFMRKHCLNWIYNSRIEDTLSHLKYKPRIQSFLQNPELILSTRMKISYTN